MTLTEESVTTVADGDFNFGTLSYSQFINADTLIVTFDGVEYECPRTVVDATNNAYGGVGQSGLDFSQYPFAVVSDSTQGSGLYTETAGTYSIKIEANESSVIAISSCFTKAVKAVVGEEVVAHMTKEEDSPSAGCVTYTLDITDTDVAAIVGSGSKLKIIDEDNHIYYPVNMFAKDVTPALRIAETTASLSIILQGVSEPLTLLAANTDPTPRYLSATECSLNIG